MVDFKVQTQRLFCTPLGWKYEVSREVSGNMSRKGGRGGGGGKKGVLCLQLLSSIVCMVK